MTKSEMEKHRLECLDRYHEAKRILLLPLEMRRRAIDQWSTPELLEAEIRRQWDAKRLACREGIKKTKEALK